MSRVGLALLALAAAGCAGSAREVETSRPAGLARAAVSTVPVWLGGWYSDGKLEFRFPTWWRRSTSAKWGQLISDNRAQHPAFVSVRYIAGPLPERRERFARLAGRTLRPPAGRGLTLLYTQTGYLGELRGFEATFVWQSRATTPLGPTMRTFGVESPDGGYAFVVFAAERPRLHAAVFGWVRQTIRWAAVPRRAAGSVIPPHRPRAYGRFVNEA